MVEYCDNCEQDAEFGPHGVCQNCGACFGREHVVNRESARYAVSWTDIYCPKRDETVVLAGRATYAEHCPMCGQNIDIPKLREALA